MMVADAVESRHIAHYPAMDRFRPPAGAGHGRVDMHALPMQVEDHMVAALLSDICGADERRHHT